MENLEEENGQGKKVVIGLSGGVSSAIAAYLLKIQKYDLTGVTILQKTNSETKCSIGQEELDRIKDFCKRLNISHITIDADEYFSESVQNQWVANRIELRPWPTSCLSCQQMRMDLLFQKMKELGAEFLSTGHFAKVFKSNDEVTVHSVHDLTLDQSSILQKLDQEILSSLLLPLASLGSAEIEKLIKNFSLTPTDKNGKECFVGPASQEFLARFSAFNTPGDIRNLLGEKLAAHTGAMTLNLGKEVLFNGQKHYVSSKQGPNILEEKEDYFLRRSVKLTQVVWSVGEEQSSPFYAYLNGPKTNLRVKVYPKTLKSVLVEFPEDLELSEYGELALYKKKGGNSKLILSGMISFILEQAMEEEFMEFVF